MTDTQQTFGSGSVLGQFWPRTDPVLNQNQMFAGISAELLMLFVLDPPAAARRRQSDEEYTSTNRSTLVEMAPERGID